MKKFDTIYELAKETLKKPKVKRRVKWSTVIVLVINFIFGIYFTYFVSQPENTNAAVAPDGILVYDNTTADSVFRYQTFTNPSTWGAENSSATTAASQHYWLKIKTAPTRNEKMAAAITAAGNLYVQTWNGSTWTNQFSVTGVTGAQTCSGTLANCYAPVDIAYEQLSGRAIVVYGKSGTNNQFFYRVWDGTSWIVGETAVTYSTAGTVPRFISLKAQGERLTNYRTNQILLALSSANDTVYANVWNGSSWGTGSDVVNNVAGSADCSEVQCADVAWETITGRGFLAWGSAAGTHSYRKWVSGTGWDSTNSTLATDGTDVPDWGFLRSDPSSDRIAYISNQITAADVQTWIWKANGSTESWTASFNDTATETQSSPAGDADWTDSGSRLVGIIQDASGVTQRDGYYADCTSSGCTVTGPITLTEVATNDDANGMQLICSSNASECMSPYGDIDSYLNTDRWNNTSWGNPVSTRNTSRAPGGANTVKRNMPYAFTYNLYSPWTRNWRFYDDENSLTPSVPLAGENTAAGVAQGNIVRLRFQAAELGGQAATNSRKKLQYTNCADPNSLSCTWTDVDEQGGSGIWRYADGAGTDDSTFTTTVLTGSDPIGVYVESGTASSTFGHGAFGSSSDIPEWDFTIENNNAPVGTTYYFRMWANDQEFPIYREQINNSTTYSYPQAISQVGNITISGSSNLVSGTVAIAVNSTRQTQTGSISSGSWSVSITKPSSGDTITVWVDGAVDSSESTAVTNYSGSGNVSGMVLNQNVLTIGSNQNTSVSVANLGQYDYDSGSDGGDEDVMHTANAGVLDVEGGANSYTDETISILSGNTLTIGGTETLDTHNVTNAGTLTSGGASTYNVSGSWNNSGTFTASTSTVNFTAGSGTETLNSGGIGAGKLFYNLTHSGAGTLQLSGNAIDVNGNFQNTGGTFDCNSQNQYFGGDFSLSAGTTYISGGILTFDKTGSQTITDSTASTQNLGIVTIGPSTTTTVVTSSNIKVTNLTIGSDDTLNITDDTLTITGTGTPFTINAGGTFTTTNSTVIYTGTTTTTNITTTTYNNLTLNPTAATTYNLTGNLTGANALSGNLTINTNATLDTTALSYNITLGGNWDNNGTFLAHSSTVTFNATTTGKTIEAGNSSFYNIVFNSPTGGWTIQNDNLVATNNFTITDTATSGFTVNGVTVEVQGNYNIADAETANTTWTSATLYLNSGTSYTIGSKNQSPENYDTLKISANTDIRLWNSTAITFIVDSTGSLYSQDHANVDGDLYIWGDYHTQTNDYWSYAKDFDGTVAERQVNVRIDPSANVTVDSGDTLEIIGLAITGRTSISRQGSSGGYGITVSNGGAINFQYADFDYLEGNTGLNIQAGATVTSLDYTKFDNLVGTANTDDAFITVASSVIGSTTKTITGVQFDNTGSQAEFNVNRTGSDDTGYWDFDLSTGTFDGESYDGKDGTDEADPGMLRWDDSTTNQLPNSPSDLAQKKTDDTNLFVGAWTNETSIKFTATASDPDLVDTLYLCVEKDPIGTAFSGTEDACGAGVVYSGTPVTVTVTISSQTDNTEYHWQARIKDAAGAYSSWVSFGGNAESEHDYGIDTSAPTGGSIADGTDSSDDDYNNGSLSQLSAFWSTTEPNFSVSGKPATNVYQYAIGTTQGGNDIKDWTWTGNNGTDTTVTATGLSLQTNQRYYFSVRAYDAAGNFTTIYSNGQEVLPQISFSLDSNTVTFANLNNDNNYTDDETSVLTTSTNAYNGYIIKVYLTDYLRSLVYPSIYIGDFQGTYSAPETWSPPGDGKFGFGYSTSDCDVNSGLFWSGAGCTPPQKFARFSQVAPGDTVVDHSGPIIGSPIINESFTITYRVAVQNFKEASTYRTFATYIVVPNF